MKAKKIIEVCISVVLIALLSVSTYAAPTPALPSYAHTYSSPLGSGKINQYYLFGEDNGRGYGHEGIDYPCSVGTTIKCIKGGTIKKVETVATNSSYGIHVIVENSDGKYVIYAHLSSVGNSPITGNRWVVGNSISTGDAIGASGNTGNSTGPHLHLSIRDGGSSYGYDINPEWALASSVSYKSALYGAVYNSSGTFVRGVQIKGTNVKKDSTITYNNFSYITSYLKPDPSYTSTRTAFRDEEMGINYYTGQLTPYSSSTTVSFVKSGYTTRNTTTTLPVSTARKISIQM